MREKVGDQRRNFVFALLQGTFMRINLTFADASTVLSVFIYKLTRSDLMVGLTGSMLTAGWMWPQLLMSNLLEHRPRKMPFYALGMSIRVLSWLAIFCCTIGIGTENPVLLSSCFLALYFLSTSAMGVSTLPYMDIISKAIAPNRRARFFSLRQLCGGFFAIWVGFLVRAILSDDMPTSLGFPNNYALLFICSMSAALLSFISFLGVREPIHPVHPTRQPIWQHLKQGPHFLRTDPNYRRFLFFRICLHFSGMATPFYTTYAVYELGVSEATIGFFIVCSALSGVISNAIWGYIGEKHGVRWLLIITAGLMIFPPAIASFSGMLSGTLLLTAYLLLFAIGGILTNGMMVGFMAYMLNIAPPRQRPSYIGFMNTLLLPASFAPAVGGLLRPRIGYQWLFTICVCICFIAFYVATGLQEIMHEHEAETETEM